MKHNTLLLLIFIPILVYQLYHTFRYWKEGLEPKPEKESAAGPRTNIPDFCKGKDGGINGELWTKKTDESKCKWKGVPEDDKTHCLYKMKEWCEKDCKGKFDKDSGGDWCIKVGSAGKDNPNVPDQGAPYCDDAFLEEFEKKCPFKGNYDEELCKCWKNINFDEATCKLPPGLADHLGGPTGAAIFKMQCSKGYNKTEFIRMVMSEGSTAEDAEISWNALSKDGKFSSETIKNYILKATKEASRKERDAAERKEHGIAPPPNAKPPPKSTVALDSAKKPSAWVKGKQNSLCSTGMQIKTKSDCEIALEDLGLKSTSWWTGNNEQLPSGCSWKGAGGKSYYGKPRDAHWNAYTSGPGKPRSDLYPICASNKPVLSGKAAAAASKTRKMALASGKSVAEADNDAKEIAAKTDQKSDTSKEKIKEIIRNIAGGGGSIAAQAIGSHLQKLNSEKESAEAAMDNIPKGENAPAKGVSATGSLDATPTANTSDKNLAEKGLYRRKETICGGNPGYCATGIRQQNWGRTAACCYDPVIGSQSGECMSLWEKCAKYYDTTTNKYSRAGCKAGSWINKSGMIADLEPAKSKCGDFPPLKCPIVNGKKKCPPVGESKGGQTQECSLCRTRGGGSRWCELCKKICEKEGRIWDGKDCSQKGEGCKGTQYGCCNDGITPRNKDGTCTYKPVIPEKPGIGGCKGTQYGCCSDGITARNKDGTNCGGNNNVGGCTTTQYGCCSDGITARNKDGTNCGSKPPSGQPISGTFKAWIDGASSKFQAQTSQQTPQQTSQQEIIAHEKQFHSQNSGSQPKKSDLKGTSLKTVSSEVNKNGWCIPQRNKQGKILSWIAKSTNTPGWTNTDKCLTIEGKEIIFGTGSCLQGQTQNECNLGLVKLEKDKYWHTHPVLLKKPNAGHGPRPTPLGSKYV